LLGVHSLGDLRTRAVTNSRHADRRLQPLRSLSMTAPIASGWSVGSRQKPRGVGFTEPQGAIAKRIAPCSWRQITLRYFLKSAGFRRRRWGHGLRINKEQSKPAALLVIAALVRERLRWVKFGSPGVQLGSPLYPPITDILGDRLARLSSGGRKCFQSRSNMTSALPAPEQADEVLRSPWRLETG
jgi:hypothetical protein